MLIASWLLNLACVDLDLRRFVSQTAGIGLSDITVGGEAAGLLNGLSPGRPYSYDLYVQPSVWEDMRDLNRHLCVFRCERRGLYFETAGGEFRVFYSTVRGREMVAAHPHLHNDVVTDFAVRSCCDLIAEKIDLLKARRLSLAKRWRLVKDVFALYAHRVPAYLWFKS